MTTPPDLLQRSPTEAAARVARSWLADARQAAARLGGADDAEALHDFRVGLRRLRSTLRAWRRELDGAATPRRRRRLAALQRETGAARDCEVALAWLADPATSLSPTEQAGSDHLVALLEARQAEAMGRVRAKVLADFERRAARLDERLRRVRVTLDLDAPTSAGFGIAVAAKLRRAADRLDDRLARVGGFGGVEDRPACHRARIAGKRLRTLLEPLGEPAGEARTLCKQLQDDLGAFNDAHVLAAEIRSIEAHAPAAAREGLAALGERVDERAAALYRTLQGRWLDDCAAELRNAVATLAARCELAAAPDLEIERKYLLKRLPEIEGLRASGHDVESLEIEQGWLPGQRLRERLRRTRRADGSEEYRRTIKLGSGVARIEIEEETTRDVFETLWPLTAGCRVRKRRHRVRVGDRVWEIDEFLDRELALAEVELPDAQRLPQLPDWLDVAREVTDDGKYTNLALAR